MIDKRSPRRTKM